MRSLIGPEAQRLAARIPESLSVIVTDTAGENIAIAYREAIRRRESGTPFYGLILFENRNVRVGNQIAAGIIQQVPDYDRARFAFDQLFTGQLRVDTRTSGEIFAEPVTFPNILGEFMNLCDTLLVRSYDERRKVLVSARVYSDKPFRRVAFEPVLPHFERIQPKRPSIVVWCGVRPATEAAIALFGLREFRGDVAYVAETRLPFDVGYPYYKPYDPMVPELLGRASAVLCINAEDPGDAIAFARTGVGVISPIPCGAYEFAEDLSLWNPLDSQYIYLAVNTAIARGASVERPHFSVPDLPQRPRVDPSGDLPLVTIITATRNRREYLKQMLQCVQAQTYPNIESVIVNDGGEAIDDIVAEFPFARLLNLPQNRGVLNAAYAGLEIARGEFIGLLPDDDWLYPPHVELLVAALLRSGAAVAHGLSIVRYQRRTPDGRIVTYGFNSRNYSVTVGPTEGQIGTGVAGHQCLQARATFDEGDVGWYLSDYVAADQEYHFRLTEKHQFAWVHQYTCEFRDHPANSGKQYKLGGRNGKGLRAQSVARPSVGRGGTAPHR